MTVVLPGPQEPLIDVNTGHPTESWYRYFSQGTLNLNSTVAAGLASSVASLTASVSDLLAIAGNSPSLNVQVISSTTGNVTYNPKPQTAYALVIGTGGGGGSGGCKVAGADTTGADLISGAGEGGATFIKLLSATQIGTGATVSIGAFGTAGSSTGGNGGNGGNTVVSFAASTLTAIGGGGGTASRSSGATAGTNSPTASGGDLNLSGHRSMDNGGSSFWGGGGVGRGGRVLATSSPIVGGYSSVYGCGAGASQAYFTTAGAAGQAGAGGVAVFIEFLTATTT